MKTVITLGSSASMIPASALVQDISSRRTCGCNCHPHRADQVYDKLPTQHHGRQKTKQNKTNTHKKHTTWTVTCLFLFLFLLGSDAFCQRRTLRGKAKSRQGCVYTSTKFLPIGKKRSSFSSVRFLQRT